MQKVIPKKYNFKTVKGITENQLQQHYQLYVGYVNKINEIWDILRTQKVFNKPNTTYGEMRSLKLGESYALDGVKLHELYFGNMTGNYTKVHGPILTLINRDFGSYDNFVYRLKQVALSMRGWAVLALDPLDRRLHIIGQDSHDQGSIWSSLPLLVLDVYEHAYMIDFGIDRSKYFDIFMKNIDWAVVNRRLRSGVRK